MCPATPQTIPIVAKYGPQTFYEIVKTGKTFTCDHNRDGIITVQEAKIIHVRGRIFGRSKVSRGELVNEELYKKDS